LTFQRIDKSVTRFVLKTLSKLSLLIYSPTICFTSQYKKSTFLPICADPPAKPRANIYDQRASIPFGTNGVKMEFHQVLKYNWDENLRRKLLELLDTLRGEFSS